MKIYNMEITNKQAEEISLRYFKSIEPPVLQSYPSKLKKRAAVLMTIAKSFEAGKDYLEKQVNEILKAIYPDFVTLRRDLYDAKLIDREKDGSKYWKEQR